MQANNSSLENELGQYLTLVSVHTKCAMIVIKQIGGQIVEKTRRHSCFQDTSTLDKADQGYKTIRYMVMTYNHKVDIPNP